MKHAVFGPTKLKGDEDYYSNLEHVSACLKTVSDVSGFILGGGKGVEQLAEQYARANRIDVVRVAPDFHSLYGSKVKTPGASIDSVPVNIRQVIFAQRNDKIINKADRVIAFWDGEFFEIGHLIQRALSLRKSVLVFPL